MKRCFLSDCPNVISPHASAPLVPFRRPQTCWYSLSFKRVWQGFIIGLKDFKCCCGTSWTTGHLYYVLYIVNKPLNDPTIRRLVSLQSLHGNHPETKSYCPETDLTCRLWSVTYSRVSQSYRWYLDFSVTTGSPVIVMTVCVCVPEELAHTTLLR